MMTAQVVVLHPKKPKPSTGLRTSFRINEVMYLTLKEIQQCEAEHIETFGYDMPFRFWKSLNKRGLIAVYKDPDRGECVCVSPLGREALESWEDATSSAAQ
jgi:hypothetical protein